MNVAMNVTYGADNKLVRNRTRSIEDNTSMTNEDSKKTKNSSYKERVLSDVSTRLCLYDLEPYEDSINLFDKKYTEDGFDCTQHNKLFGGKTIVKEKQLQLVDTIGLLGGQHIEKIIDEYDKNGVKTKETYYNNDGSYTVTKYNKDGSVKKMAKVTSNNKDESYACNVEVTTYSPNDKYTVETISYKQDDDNLDEGRPIPDTSFDYYNADGTTDLLLTAGEKVLDIAVKMYLS